MTASVRGAADQVLQMHFEVAQLFAEFAPCGKYLLSRQATFRLQALSDFVDPPFTRRQ
jgi:hypothetical protein